VIGNVYKGAIGNGFRGDRMDGVKVAVGSGGVDGGDGLFKPRRSSCVPVPRIHSSILVAKNTFIQEPVLVDFISLLVSSDALYSHVESESLVFLEEATLAEHLMPSALLVSLALPSTKWNLKKKPQSYAEACAHPDAAAWRAVMDREISGLKDMGAFLECDLPQRKKPLTLKWVFAIKMDAEGQIIHGKEKVCDKKGGPYPLLVVFFPFQRDEEGHAPSSLCCCSYFNATGRDYVPPHYVLFI